MDIITTKIVDFISKTNPEFTDLELKKMKYGLICFFNEITKLIPYYILFNLFGLQWYFLVAIIFFSSLRLFIGGYHAKTYWGCFFFSLVLLCIIVFAGITIKMNFISIAILLLISYILIYIFAPVDNVNKRILSKERYMRLKYISIMIIALLSLLCLIIPDRYKVTAILSIAAAIIMMLAGKLDNIRIHQ